LFGGVSIAFAESFDTLGRDLALVKPTVLTAVPRVFAKMQARILDKGHAGSASTVAIFRWAIRVAQAQGAAQLRGRTAGAATAVQRPLADRLVFARIRENVGGRLRIIASGSAPLAPAIAELFAGLG